MGRSFGSEREVKEQSHMFMQINRPLSQLEPSRAHVWPFELELPMYLSSSANTRPQRSESPYAMPRRLILYPDDWGVDQIEEPEGKGGVRSETMGYGAGWDVTDRTGLFQLHQQQKEEPIKHTILNGTPHRIILDGGTCRSSFM